VIVNPYPVTVALCDKIITSRILQMAAVPTPATYVASRPDHLGSLLDGGPLIVKPYQGSDGFGVRVVRSVAELAAVPAGKDPVFAQRYYPPQGRDRKMYVIGAGCSVSRKSSLPGPMRRSTASRSHPRQNCARSPCAAAGRSASTSTASTSSRAREAVRRRHVQHPRVQGVPDGAAHLASYLYVVAERAAGTVAVRVGCPTERCQRRSPVSVTVCLAPAQTIEYPQGGAISGVPELGSRPTR